MQQYIDMLLTFAGKNILAQQAIDGVIQMLIYTRHCITRL